MYLSNEISPKYLWLIEMLIQIGAIITCFILLIICYPSYPDYDQPPEKDLNIYIYYMIYL